MQRSGLNVMVFDEESSYMTQQSKLNNSTLKRQTSAPTYDNLQQSEQVICSQLKMLNEKITTLQAKTSRLQQSFKANNYPTSASQISRSTSNLQNNQNIQNISGKQIDQLLRAIQHKIQIIIKETKKIIEKLTTDFDKKLLQINSQKNHETKSITKIQNHYQQALGQIQQNYKQKLDAIQQNHSSLQTKLIARVQEIQKQFVEKKREFLAKEQEYIKTIDHLEGKLKIAHKNRKILEVTQEKRPGIIQCNVLENISATANKAPEMNGLPPPPNDTSKRRRKIFQGRSSSRSISPNSQVLSPIKSSKQTQSITKNPKAKQQQLPQTYYSKDQRFQASQTQQNRNQPISNNYMRPQKSQYSQNIQTQYSQYSQVSYPENSAFSQRPASSVSSVNIKKSNHNAGHQRPQNQHQSNNYIENEKIKNKPNDPQVKSPLQQGKREEVKKETPKGEWERFQDFDENESSGEQEDVFFYPGNDQSAQEPKAVFEYGSTHNDQLSSPFDLN